MEDKGFVNSFDDVYAELIKNRKKEGLPLKIVEKLLGNFMYDLMAKYTEKVKKGEK